MSTSGSRSKPSSSLKPGSYSLSSSGVPSSSRPFLNMLNPMNSTYHGYMKANQSVVEENEGDATEDVDLEAGSRSTIFHSSHDAKPSATAQGKRRVAWDPGASEMNILHPNIHKEDKMHDSSDDEVPPSFMVEPTTRPATSPKFTRQSNKSESGHSGRSRALYSTDGRRLPPILPTVVDKSPTPVKTPPISKLSELNEEPERSRDPRTSTPSQGSNASYHQTRPTMRGLDDYEKALWKWVNVYNLDAFLQEVYSYYEGKGIYSIALSRGLNLL